jgi:hypothetical protein
MGAEQTCPHTKQTVLWHHIQLPCAKHTAIVALPAAVVFPGVNVPTWQHAFAALTAVFAAVRPAATDTAAADTAQLFTATFAVIPSDTYKEGHDWIDSVTTAVVNHIRKNSAEAIVEQSIQSACLTLNCVVQFNKLHVQTYLQAHMRQRQVLKHLPKDCDPFKTDCIVTARDENKGHEIYESIRRCG